MIAPEKKAVVWGGRGTVVKKLNVMSYNDFTSPTNDWIEPPNKKLEAKLNVLITLAICPTKSVVSSMLSMVSGFCGYYSIVTVNSGVPVSNDHSSTAFPVIELLKSR